MKKLGVSTGVELAECFRAVPPADPGQGHG